MLPFKSESIIFVQLEYYNSSDKNVSFVTDGWTPRLFQGEKRFCDNPVFIRIPSLWIRVCKYGSSFFDSDGNQELSKVGFLIRVTTEKNSWFWKMCFYAF